MSLRTELQTEVAAAFLAVSKELMGQKYRYYKEDKVYYVPVYLQVDPKFPTQFRNTQEVTSTVDRTLFYIPRQSTVNGDFPPNDDLSIGDVLVNDDDSDERWRVVDFNWDQVGAVVTITAERSRLKVSNLHG